MVKKREIAEAIKLANSSFVSHIDWAWKDTKDKSDRKRGKFGGTDFHQKAMREYLQIMGVLTRLL